MGLAAGAASQRPSAASAGPKLKDWLYSKCRLFFRAFALAGRTCGLCLRIATTGRGWAAESPGSVLLALLGPKTLVAGGDRALCDPEETAAPAKGRPLRPSKLGGRDGALDTNDGASCDGDLARRQAACSGGIAWAVRPDLLDSGLHALLVAAWSKHFWHGEAALGLSERCKETRACKF